MNGFKASGGVQLHQDAGRIIDSIQTSLANVMTPERASALMHLKGLSTETLGSKALVSPVVLEHWMGGSSPMMPLRVLNRVELVLGVEKGELVQDRIHVLHLNEPKLGKDDCAKRMQEALPLFKRSVMSVVCDESGNDSWLGGARIYILGMPQGGHAILVHTTRGRLIASPVTQHLASIAWADHGTHGSDRSDLIIPAHLSKQLTEQMPTEGDQLSSQLVQHFAHACVSRATVGVRQLQPRR